MEIESKFILYYVYIYDTYAIFVFPHIYSLLFKLSRKAKRNIDFFFLVHFALEILLVPNNWDC